MKNKTAENGYRPNFLWHGDPDTGLPFNMTKEQREHIQKIWEEARPKNLPTIKPIIIFGTKGEI